MAHESGKRRIAGRGKMVVETGKRRIVGRGKMADETEERPIAGRGKMVDETGKRRIEGLGKWQTRLSKSPFVLVSVHTDLCLSLTFYRDGFPQWKPSQSTTRCDSV